MLKCQRNPPRLILACKGGGGGANESKRTPPARFCMRGCRNNRKSTPSSLLHAREVEKGRTALECRKDPHPACTCMRGRWWWPGWHRKAIKIHLRLALAREGGGMGTNGSRKDWKATSGSLLHVKEVAGARADMNGWKGHLRLAVTRKEGGGGADDFKTPSKLPPGWSCTRGRRWWVEQGQNDIKNPSGSLLHAREVVWERTGSKRPKNHLSRPPARSYMRGR